MPCRKPRTHRAVISASRIQVFGAGPVDLVYAGSFVSHIELAWTMPEYEAFMEQLATFCRVLVFDKAGVGLSDPVPQVRTLDDRAAEIEAATDDGWLNWRRTHGMTRGRRHGSGSSKPMHRHATRARS